MSINLMNQSIKKITYPNGLTCLLWSKPYSNTVIIRLTINAGSINDPKGKLGTAHLLEHLVVSGSKNYPTPVDLARIILDHGGIYKVFTEREYIKYETETIYNHIEDGFKYLSEAILNPLLTKEAVVREKKIITQEIKSINADPNNQFWKKILENQWPSSWKSSPITGTVKSLNSITLDDVTLFHKTYYQPKNIVAIISGKFDEKNLINLINQYLK
jgi:zinc protease